MQVMYLLFKYKNMKPSEFYWLPIGEKKILGCFIKREIEDINPSLYMDDVFYDKKNLRQPRIQDEEILIIKE